MCKHFSSYMVVVIGQQGTAVSTTSSYMVVLSVQQFTQASASSMMKGKVGSLGA